MTRSRCCEAKLDATPTTATSPTSSASYRRRARSSIPAGQDTTSATHDTGKKRFHHPVVGDLELTFEVLTLVANPDLTMFAFTAEPGSTSDEALDVGPKQVGSADGRLSAGR
jgi:hypothetical protein